MTKPTRGGWEWDFSGIAPLIAPGLAIADGETFADMWIAKVRCLPPSVDPNLEITRANARLMASAPDLLEALEMLLQTLGHTRQHHIDQARAAIKKAKGEDHAA